MARPVKVLGWSSVGVLLTGAAQGAGLPQLDVATYPSQIVWLLLSFGVLYIVVLKLGLPRITTTLSDRQQQIDRALRMAARAQEEAKALDAGMEAELERAREEAREKLRRGQLKIAQSMEKEEAALAGKLEARMQEARDAIQLEQTRVMGELDSVVLESSRAALQRLGFPADDKTLRGVIQRQGAQRQSAQGQGAQEGRA